MGGNEGKELEKELEEMTSKEREEKWLIDEVVWLLRQHMKDFPRYVVDLPFLRDELKRWGVRLIIKNESTSVFTLVIVEDSTVKVMAKTEEEFLRLLMDMIAERLRIARTW